MGSREITVWIDERWYDALSKQLKDETLEDHLGDVLDEMCGQLPESVQERISQEIWEERQRDQEQQEAAKRYAVFCVKEHGQERYLQVERGLELLDAARLLRMYLRQERGASEFRQMIHAAEDITKDAFYDRIQERLENIGKVTGAFELDFDRHEFSALHIMDGWNTYSMKDVSAAVYHADRKQCRSTEERWARFLEKLDGKEWGYIGNDMGLNECDGVYPQEQRERQWPMEQSL